MLEVILIYPTEEGSQEIPAEKEKTSFGRGSEADYRFDDDGLSRLNSTIYREGDDVWIIDENSTNGSFVNGEKVNPHGTPLRNGDEIKIGHYTSLQVRIYSKKQGLETPVSTESNKKAVSASDAGFPMMVPLLITAFAIFVIGGSAIFIGVKVFGNGDPEIVQNSGGNDDLPTPGSNENDNKNNKEKTPKPTATVESTPDETNTSEPINANQIVTIGGKTVQLPKGPYQQMSEDDKNLYIAIKAEKIARIIGNQKGDPIPPEAVKEIKVYINGYASRLKSPKKDTCEKGWTSSDFVSVLTRATQTSPMITRIFRSEGIKPEIGIYVAMIEGEHCPCLTSSTGAKGMFQFLASSWGDYDPDKNPNDRCIPEKSARAGAVYLKQLITRYGAASDSVPLAIASFNSGQGNLSQNLDKVLNEAAGQDRSFWTLVANKNVLQGSAGKQFNNENIKYVPKFFATAIIGENPKDFGVTSLSALSTYTK